MRERNVLKGEKTVWNFQLPSVVCLQAIAARASGEPCCDWVGEGGAGHFVKMVHNGIEYGDMQLICEAYHLMKSVLGMKNDEMSQVLTEFWKPKSFAIL